MLKKPVIFAVIASLILAQAALFAQEKAAGAGSPDEGVTRDDRIPIFMKRLVEGIKNLKLEPDQDGRYIFTIKSGYTYDELERQHLMVYRKAYVYMSGDRVSKLVFEYYQFNMDTKVRDIKVFTNSTPESAELRSLQIDYNSNTGDKEKYTVGDVQKREMQRNLISQYVNYLISLIYNLELYKHKTVRMESLKIERTIQLGE